MSMNCKRSEEYLVEYLYQELSPKKTLEIEKHLRSCSHCTKTLESWRAIHLGYQRSAEDPQVAPYFKQKILAAAEEELQRVPSWKDRLLVGLKIATVPIAIFLILILFNEKQTPPSMATKQEQHAVPAKEAPQITETLQRPLTDADEAKRKDEIGKQYASDQLKAAPQSLAEEKPSPSRDLREQEGYQPEAKKETHLYQYSPASPPPPAAEAPAENQPGAGGAVSPSAEPKQQLQGASRRAEITSVSKTNPNAPFWQGQNKLEKNDLRAGVKDLQKAINEDDSKELASEFHQAGTVYQNKGDYKNAIIQFKLVQTNYRNYQYMDDVLLRLGDSYAEIGQYGDAVKAYNQVSAAQQKVAQQRIRQLEKKQEAQEQLKALGYIESNKP
jgi:hypothetical protein